MQFEVLGPLQVVAPDGTPVAIPSPVHRRLLSVLILRAGTPVSADYLGDCMDISAGALRVAVSRLRRVVGFDTLVTAPPGYELRPQSVDVAHFERLLASATHESESARAALSEALGLWRGDAYAEFAHEEWATVEVRRLGGAAGRRGRGSRRDDARSARMDRRDRRARAPHRGTTLP